MVDKCVCGGCGRNAEDIHEYVEVYEEYGYGSASEYVRHEEGTYNYKVDMFWCTDCYIRNGMPLGVYKD